MVEALESKGFYNCTPIQAFGPFPLTLAVVTLQGRRQTGARKTMAFRRQRFIIYFIPRFSIYRKVNQPRALTHMPTRISRTPRADAEPLAQSDRLKISPGYGGDGHDKQLKVLESGVDILGWHDGRLIDYAKQNHINLGAIQVVVPR